METKVKLLKFAHTVGESNLHLQLTPKYRKPIFRDQEVMNECEQLFHEIANDLNIQLSGLGFGPDHVHLFLSSWKNYSIAELAQRFKGRTSKKIREKFLVRLSVQGLYGTQMWSDGYFHRTVGAVTSDTMRKYVTESQKKHWIAEKPVPQQTTLLQFH